MPAPTEPDRRFTFALTAAVAATTVAVGVTAATLLGWLRPSEVPKTAAAPPAEPSLVYVPVAPTAPPDPPATVPAAPSMERVAIDHSWESEDREHEREREDHDD
jgi:hypothetical protein